MVLTTSVERDGLTYFITLGDKKICTTLAQEPSDVKDWISQIEKRYWNKKGKKNKKQPPLVVGLWADRSIYYPDGRHIFHPKDAKCKWYPFIHHWLFIASYWLQQWLIIWKAIYSNLSPLRVLCHSRWCDVLLWNEILLNS